MVREVRYLGSDPVPVRRWDDDQNAILGGDYRETMTKWIDAAKAAKKTKKEYEEEKPC